MAPFLTSAPNQNFLQATHLFLTLGIILKCSDDLFFYNLALIFLSLRKTVDYCQIKGVPFSLSLGKPAQHAAQR